jgi:uncharacterized protein YjiS (DUF1127 family)
MNPCNEHTNPCNSLQKAHTDPQKQLNRQIDGIFGFSTFRLINGLESIVRRCVGRISHWRERHIMIRKLQALNEHYLKDIGLERSEIISMVEGVIGMDTKSKYRAGRDNSNRFWNRTCPNGNHGEPISSTVDKRE